jgi:hypothetical protein
MVVVAEWIRVQQKAAAVARMKLKPPLSAQKRQHAELTRV